jgi:DNA helicase-2/ATP-dependent DNA helicase PcrA
VERTLHTRHSLVTLRLRFATGSGRGRRYVAPVNVLDELNAEQRHAVEAVQGPVCILAGAGSGKTMTITCRIARQVSSGAFRPSEILAVTFTDKAAGVMKARLAALGVPRIQARTFHSAALAQLHRYAPDSLGRILPTKALLLRQIANSLPGAYRFRPAADLATEIERAKNRRVRQNEYLASLDGHEPPIPPDLMLRVYREYERRKAARGELDFEDVLERAVCLLEEDDHARGDLRDRYSAFTVDEYQDVNLLQQTLLELWVGPRDDLCVVGDDYQSIYAFTGASPQWLLGMRERYPNAAVVRLEDNYRSSPQVLEFANRLVPRLGGAEKVLRATRPGSREPVVHAFATQEAEGAAFVDAVRALSSEGVAYEEMAVLCRTNARLADFEELLHDAGIPFQGSSLLEREAARRMVRLLESNTSTDVGARVRALAADAGWLPVLPERLGERELVRQTDLARLVRLASAFEDGVQTCADFVVDLQRRFDPGGDGARGVHLLTYHRAKGLEFEAVFLPRLEDKELPWRLAKSAEERAEERRLLYVGMTRARRFLTITWSKRPSPFVAELGVAGERAAAGTAAAPRTAAERRAWPPAAEALRRWRSERARADGVPAYVVFPDRTIDEIVSRRPQSPSELAAIHGLGPSRLARFGRELYAAVKEVLALPSEAVHAGEPAPTADPDDSSFAGGSRPPLDAAVDGLYDALAVWRRAQAEREEVPAFHVFHNRVLDQIARARPRTRDELAAVPGVGPSKLERYGDELLEVVAAA